jgi:hypothetical protein
MFSLALVLVERGQLAEAGQWLERARVEGNMNFLRAALVTLQAAGPVLMALRRGMPRRSSGAGRDGAARRAAVPVGAGSRSTLPSVRVMIMLKAHFH